MDDLRGPVYAKYCKLDKVPSGATLVMSERDSRVVGGRVKNPLVRDVR